MARLWMPLLLLAALAACGAEPAPPPPPCGEALGAAEVLADPGAAIVIGTAPELLAPALAEAEKLGCAARRRGETVTVQALPPGEDVQLATLAPAPETANAAPHRAILVTDIDNAAREPLGLSGETWLPLAARLAQAGPVAALIAQPGAGAQSRMTLTRFEDLPEQGAPRVYDGVLELGAPAPEPAS